MRGLTSVQHHIASKRAISFGVSPRIVNRFQSSAEHLSCEYSPLTSSSPMVPGMRTFARAAINVQRVVEQLGGDAARLERADATMIAEKGKYGCRECRWQSGKYLPSELSRRQNLGGA